MSERRSGLGGRGDRDSAQRSRGLQSPPPRACRIAALRRPRGPSVSVSLWREEGAEARGERERLGGLPAARSLVEGARAGDGARRSPDEERGVAVRRRAALIAGSVGVE